MLSFFSLHYLVLSLEMGVRKSRGTPTRCGFHDLPCCGRPGAHVVLLPITTLTAAVLCIFVTRETVVVVLSSFRATVDRWLQYFEVQLCFDSHIVEHDLHALGCVILLTLRAGRVSSCLQVALFSATMPLDVLEVTNRFMPEPVRILVKKDELTLEGEGKE